jgi:hypothetical protein
MPRPAPLVALLVGLAGCASSAPYTLPAAILNTTLAVGAAAAQKSSGGCIATCTNGTVCNPRTGTCERVETADVCVPQADGSLRCVPPGTDIVVTEQAPPPAGVIPENLRVAPTTPPAPPPPADSSPGKP